MNLTRLQYDPTSALIFYEESLSALGALCERTWHDRLEVVAEGPAGRLWNEAGSLHEQELVFAPADATSARDANREVFPGCPLTFRLAELLRPSPLVLEKAVLREGPRHQLPHREVLEKLWRVQFPATRQWRLETEPKKAFHFSLVALARCEIQAIDQHWSLHRLAVALPTGDPDDLLAQEIPLLEVESESQALVGWPSLDVPGWLAAVRQHLERELAPSLAEVRARQEQCLQREIQRIDEYFTQYEKELVRRGSRSAASAGVKSAERLAAARAEHARRRLDQVGRHEVNVRFWVDALLLVAEYAWRVDLRIEEQRAAQVLSATFVPRARQWFLDSTNTPEK